MADVLRRDPIVHLTLAAIGLALLLYAGLALADLGTPLVRRVVNWIFLLLPTIALARDLGRVRDHRERLFWRQLAFAYGCWCLLAAFYLFYPLPQKPLPVQIFGEALLAVFFALLVLALEWHPPDAPGSESLDLKDRTLILPAVTIFVLGLEIYFVLIPLVFHLEGYQSFVPSFTLYIVFDMFIAGRLIFLFRKATHSRWRAIYGVLSCSMVAMTLADTFDVLAIAGVLEVARGTWPDLALVPQFALVVLAARLRHVRFSPGPPAEAHSQSPTDDLPALSRRSMIFAFSLTILHFGGYGLGIFSELSRGPRMLLVTVWVFFLGSIAFMQYRFLERKAHTLWHRHRETERRLQHKAAGMRLSMERKKTGEALDANDERFSQVFAASPRGMAIFNRNDLRLLEANQSFGRSCGAPHEELSGLSLEDLGIFSAGKRAALLGELEIVGAVRRREAEIRTRDGEPRSVRISLEPLEFSDLPCLLLLLEDLTERQRSLVRIRRRGDLVERIRNTLAEAAPGSFSTGTSSATIQGNTCS